MRLPCCICVPTKSLKAGIVESEETDIARQRLGKHGLEATNTHATIELLDAGFYMRSVSC
jgi:hypothetical protein